MKKQILYILLLLPAIFLFEKGICQISHNERSVLILEKTNDLNSKINVQKVFFHENEKIKMTLRNNDKVEGRITKITDSTIKIWDGIDINISDIKTISHHTGYAMAIGGGLMLVGGSLMFAALINGTITYGAYAGFIPSEIGFIIFLVGAINKIGNPTYFVDKGWKMYVITAPTKPRPFNIIK